MANKIPLPPLAVSRDVVPLDGVRAALIEARRAIISARDLLRSIESHQRVADLIVSIEHEIDEVEVTAELAAEDDAQRAVRANFVLNLGG